MHFRALQVEQAVIEKRRPYTVNAACIAFDFVTSLSTSPELARVIPGLCGHIDREFVRQSLSHVVRTSSLRMLPSSLTVIFGLTTSDPKNLHALERPLLEMTGPRRDVQRQGTRSCISHSRPLLPPISSKICDVFGLGTSFLCFGYMWFWGQQRGVKTF